MDDLGIIVASLRRMVNYHDSCSHRLPPELLVAVASHLKENASLVAATHVCHLLRVTLVSSPHLWSHLDFAYEAPALVFLKRSKSALLSVNLTDVDNPSEIVRESLKKIATRVITLRAVHNSFLDGLLSQPVPALEGLEITERVRALARKSIQYQCLPSLTSFAIHGFDPLRFHAPLLTSFHITHKPGSSREWQWATRGVLDFLRGCPLLEVVFLGCDIQTTHYNADKLVSLPLLRSFTHESSCHKYELRLFNRLSIPSTCRVVLSIDVTNRESYPWTPGLAAPRDSTYLSDIRTVKIAARPGNLDARERQVTLKIELANSTHGAISFDRTSRYPQRPFDFSHEGFLDILESNGINSVETLCFDRYPVFLPKRFLAAAAECMTDGLEKFRNLKTLILSECNITLFIDGLTLCPTVDTVVISFSRYARSFYDDVVCLLQAVEKSPLKALTIVYPFSDPPPSKFERLARCVGCVEIVRDRDALKWDVNEYLLSAATRNDSASRS